jgi:hypothetical protein
MSANEVVGVMLHESDGRSITVVAAAPGALPLVPVEVFPTADDKQIVAAVDSAFLSMLAEQENPQQAIENLGRIIGKMAEMLEPVDLSWVYESLDN